MPSTERVSQGEIATVQDNEAADRREWLLGLRARADEVRKSAERMTYPAARNTMLRLADTFEKLAERLEITPRPSAQEE
jgi:hypothetical protein